MPLGLILGLGRAFRRKRTSSLDILSSKRAPRDYYKGKNCKPTGFHTRKAKYVVQQEKLPNYIVPDLTDFKADTCDGRIGPCQKGRHKSSPKEWMQLKPYVSQCPREVKNTQSAEPTK